MGITYRDSGVDIDAGNQLVERIKPAIQRTMRPEILNDIGGFAAFSSIPSKYRDPVLVCGTDGVGTKLELVAQHDRHDLVGHDLVAMCVNDILVYGAEPLLFLDYFATGKLEVAIAERVISGIADACVQAGCALPGGETAEMPGMYQVGSYDLAGFCVGVAERDQLNGRSKVEEGDQLIALASKGPHSNGYSLIRKLVCKAEERGTMAKEIWDELLAPTRIYAKSVLPIADKATGMAHISGGGLIENPPRMLSDNLAIMLDLSAWPRHRCFDWLQRQGDLSEYELLRTFNCGIGFLIAVREFNAREVCERLSNAGEQPYVVGSVVSQDTVPLANCLVVDQAGCAIGKRDSVRAPNSRP